MGFVVGMGRDGDGDVGRVGVQGLGRCERGGNEDGKFGISGFGDKMETERRRRSMHRMKCVSMYV